MERYEAYKDSGVEWIGDIPEGWETRRVKSAVKRKGEAGHPHETVLSLYRDHGVVIKDSRDDNFNRTSENIEAYRFVEVNDLVVNKMKAWQGSLAVSGYRGIVSPAYYVYRITDNSVLPRYMHYQLRDSSYLPEYRRLSGGIRPAQWDLSSDNFVNIPMLVPPLSEQQAIADYLDAKTAEVDALVADCEREVGLLREYRKAVISEAVTKGLDPDAPMRDSGVEWIGEIPEHWDAGKLLRHARLESGHTPSRLHPEWWVEEECTIPWITTQDVHRFRDGRITSIDDTELHVSQVGIDNSSARWLPAGTVALSRTASVGFSIVMSVPMASSQDYADWVPDESLDSFYLLYSLRSMDRVFEQLQMGSTHKTIYMPDIMKLSVAYPPIEEQRAIVSYLDVKTAEIDSLIDAKQSMADRLREYRKSLISEAVTGKFKVPGA